MRFSTLGLALYPFLASVVATSAAGQSARTPQRIDSGTQISAGDPTAASEGELSAILMRRDTEVVVTTSNDRGMTWNAPLRVDQDPTGSLKWVATEGGTPSIAIAAGAVHVVWRDGRNSEDDLWYRRSLDDGASWEAEVRLDKGFPSGTAPVREYTLAVTTVDDTAHVHVLFSVDPGAGGAFLPDELYLISSADNGASWSNAQSVSSANGTGADVDTFALDARGTDLVLVWSDDRFGSSTFDDLWILRSLDGGGSFIGPEVQLDPSGPLVGDVENEVSISSEGDLLAIAWEEEFGSVREEAWVAVSDDRGASFISTQRVGQYSPSSSDVDDVVVLVADGVVFVGWDDDRTGTDEVYTARSTDLGLTWPSDRTLSTICGGDVRLLAGDDAVVAIWSGDPAGGTGDRARATVTRDAGATWTTPSDLSNNSGDVDAARPVWNARYGNLVVPWLADDPGTNGVWVGGFRPQTLTPVNWKSGAQAHLDFSGFSGSSPWVWAFASASPGFLPLGFQDGRNLGLLPDAIFLFTLQSPAQFSALVDANGSGSTPAYLLPNAPGSVLHLVAVSLDLAPVRFDEITDVLRVVVQ